MSRWPGRAQVGAYPTGAEILRFLDHTGGCTLEQLVRRTGLSRSALRQQLVLLERDGLVHRALIRGRTGRPPIFYQPGSAAGHQHRGAGGPGL